MQQLKLLRKIKSNKTRAFTLVEMIIAISLGLMVLTIGTQLLVTSSQGSVFATREKELQDANRIFLERTNNSIKYATAVFTVPTKTFNAPDYSKLSKDWNYLGIKKDVTIPARLTSSGSSHIAQTALVDLKYVGSGSVPSGINLGDDQELITAIKSGGEKLYYVQTIIAFSEEVNGTEFVYDIVFSKDTPKNGTGEFLSSREGKGLDYKLNVKALNGTGTTKTEVDYGTVLSKITALNSFQVVDKGTPNNPAVAIAYRSDNIFKNKSGTHGVISMVLDTSGSMNWDVESNPYGVAAEKKRINILKKNAKELLNQFSATKNTDVMFVPFSYATKKINGQFPKFYSASIDKTILEQQLNNLEARGSTNTGDGLRYAFYAMGKHNQTIKTDYKDYLIILVDGQSNVATLKDFYGHYSRATFLDDDRFYEYNKMPHGLIVTREDDGSRYGRPYITHLAQNLYDNPYSKISNHDSAAAIEKMIKEKNVFLIGFSKNSNEGGSLRKLADDFHIDISATGENQRYFEANSESALALALSDIGAAITKDLWLINGPEL